jgi:hypothetical protein
MNLILIFLLGWGILMGEVESFYCQSSSSATGLYALPQSEIKVN